MHILNREFSKVVCINLLNRPDKKEFMQEKFGKLGIEVEWFHAVPYGFAKEIVESLKPSVQDYPRFNIQTPNEFGAAISHYTVIKTALLQGHKNIFVFEDDVMFRKNFNEELNKYLDKVPEDWDMIMLYSFMYKIQEPNKRVNSRWMRSYNSWSLMSYGMNKKAMEKYIHMQDINFQIADRASFKMQDPPSDINIYSTVPTLCIPNQKLGSNIRGENMNYEHTQTIINMGFGKENFE
jgi:GR25 family glycosyltransferase involved in LPS biosynthesis